MISPTEYDFIANGIDAAKKQVNDILGNLFSMHNNLEDNDILSTNSEKIQMITTIDETYQLIFNDNYVTSLNMFQTVAILQRHVITHHGDINVFLSENNITVGPFFAEISDSAGYVINPDNIST